MTANIFNWIVIILALLDGGFMAFDGTRALLAGDYIRPQSGEYAGQLGPWAKLVRKIGIDPESTRMKLIFAVYGFAWIAVIVCFALKKPWAWNAMLICAAASLWYLWIGTMSSILQIVLLLVLRFLK
jgi:hypothetical protein